MNMKQSDAETVKNVIQRRYSCRTYKKKYIDDSDQKILADKLALVGKGPFGNKARFELVAASENDSNALRDLGTYGFIKNPPAFIMGAIEENAYYLEDYGYLMEKLILKATGLGMGTCWLGGSFSKSKFAQRINLKNNEILPAVVSIGYIGEKVTMRESIIRWGAGSNKRKPWSELFFSGNESIPLNEGDVGDFEDPIEMVRIAPSASNKQPWRIIKDPQKDIYHFFLKRTKGYDRSEKMWKMVDLQRIDMGIAMCHFEMAAHDIGLKGQWSVANPLKVEVPEDAEYCFTWS